MKNMDRTEYKSMGKDVKFSRRNTCYILFCV